MTGPWSRSLECEIYSRNVKYSCKYHLDKIGNQSIEKRNSHKPSTVLLKIFGYNEWSQFNNLQRVKVT